MNYKKEEVTSHVYYFVVYNFTLKLLAISSFPHVLFNSRYFFGRTKLKIIQFNIKSKDFFTYNTI
jgi:hypothetical protein